MADTYCSAARVIWDPDDVALVLVDWGDIMTDRVRVVDGGQTVQESLPIRSVGIKTYPRGNERHVLSFGVQNEELDLEAAFEKRIERSLKLPRPRADVLIAFQRSGNQYRLKSASVKNWPSDQDGNFTDERVEIIGGEITKDVGTYVIGDHWRDLSAAGSAALSEDGENELAENGETLLNEG